MTVFKGRDAINCLRRAKIAPSDINFRVVLQLDAVQHRISNVTRDLAGVVFQDRSDLAPTAVKPVMVWIRLVRDINTNGITNLESSGHPLWYLFPGEQSDRDVDFCYRLSVDTSDERYANISSHIW